MLLKRARSNKVFDLGGVEQYNVIFIVRVKVHPSKILYPNGHVNESADLSKLEKKAEAYLKKLSVG